MLVPFLPPASSLFASVKAHKKKKKQSKRRAKKKKRKSSGRHTYHRTMSHPYNSKQVSHVSTDLAKR